MPRIKLIRLRRGDAAEWTAANPTLSEGEPGFSVDDNELKIGDGSTDWNGLSPIGGGGGGTAMSRSISQTGHGLAVADVVRFNGTDYVKAQADSAANAEVVGIVSAVADANTFTLHFGGRITGLSGLTAGTVYFLSAATAGLLTSTEPSASTDVSKPLLIADSTTTGYFFNYRGLIGGGASSSLPAGGSRLVYKYTVTGSDKASIDTGVDATEAGDNIWSGGDMLEIYMMIRTDEAGAAPLVDITVNNDSSAIYDYQRVRVANTTVTGANVLADTRWQATAHGSGGSTGYAGPIEIRIPGYANTTFWKQGVMTSGAVDQTAGNNDIKDGVIGYRSSSAITRLKIDGQGAANLKVGSQILIYKRTSS